MHTYQLHNDSNLLQHLKYILNSDDLKTFEKMIMVVIKVYQEEYGDVFPDYDTIAAAGGMSKRKAQYVVKDLVDRNFLEKKHRFKDLPKGVTKQTSNQYQIASKAQLSDTSEKNIDQQQNAQYANAPDALHSFDPSCASNAPYEPSSFNQDSFNAFTSTLVQEEEEYTTRMREAESKEYAQYADVYSQMINFQGTGLLCFHQKEFLDCCKDYRLPSCIVSELYPHIEIAIQKYHVNSIRRSIDKFAKRLISQRIDNPINWFVATFRNENLKVRTEIELSVSSYKVS